MDTWIWIVIAAVVVIAVILIIAAAMASRRRRAHLRERFGPEYDRTVGSADGRRQGERELRDREARHDELDLHPLTPAARDRYQEQWASLQSEFVDHPQVAVAEADNLVANVMRDRGYPVEKFDSNADLLSVEHGQVVDQYRKGHALYVKTVEGSASTEDLRQAVVSYRSLFEELIREDGADQPAPPAASPSASPPASPPASSSG